MNVSPTSLIWLRLGGSCYTSKYIGGKWAEPGPEGSKWKGIRRWIDRVPALEGLGAPTCIIRVRPVIAKGRKDRKKL